MIVSRIDGRYIFRYSLWKLWVYLSLLVSGTPGLGEEAFLTDDAGVRLLGKSRNRDHVIFCCSSATLMLIEENNLR